MNANKETDFGAIFERVQGMMRRMGQTDVFLSVPDKQPSHLKFQNVQETLEKLAELGHKVKVERMDSKIDDGFFGNVLWISTEPKVDDES